jgi:hypothetical protein
MTPVDLLFTFFAVFMAVGHFSFMWLGDTYFSSFGERWFVGATVGYTFFVVYDSLKANAFDFILQGRVLLVVPLIIGLLSFARFTKYRWLARYPIAALSGIGLGIFFGLNIRGSILNIIVTTVNNTVTLSPDPFTAFFSIAAVICTTTYYLYSTKYATIFHSKTGRLYYVQRLGRLFMMVSFGYLLGFHMPMMLGLVATFYIVVIQRPLQALTNAIQGLPYYISLLMNA